MLPVLGALEAGFRNDPVIVLGVHTAKFTSEREPPRIRQAMERYGVDHPVIVDRDHRIWQSFAIKAWPTLVFLRADGTIAATIPGEVPGELPEQIVTELLAEARDAGALTEKAIFEEPPPPPESGILAYPGKVTATPHGLAISDSGHHRVLLTDGKGRVGRVFGSSAPGLVDGGAETARFKRPQGLASRGDKLYVADAGNHALREIDLNEGTVTTLAGDGNLGRQAPTELTPGKEVALRSPWDLAIVDQMVVIAMAGIHQLWVYLPAEGTIGPFAGTGRESIDDGPLHEATFSQPTGLTFDGTRLYVADSETSGVRLVDLVEGRVRTLLGSGLFDFGDRDGPFEQARLQHVQDVAVGPHGLLVVDTYNDRLKRLDLERGRVESWFGGTSTNGERLHEPAGLVQLDGGQVVVADTNAHRVLIFDGEGAQPKTLPLDAGSKAEGGGRE